MKLKTLLLTAFMAGSSLVFGQQNDQQLAQFMLGHWINQQGNAEITFEGNGLYRIRIGQTAYINGMWNVHDGVIYYRVVDWYPHSIEGVQGPIEMPRPPNSSNRVRVLDRNHVQDQDGNISTRQ